MNNTKPKIKSLSNLVKVILICFMLNGCTTTYKTFTTDKNIYSFDYLNLKPNQTLIADEGIIEIKQPIRIWSDKAYIEAHEQLLLK